MSLTFTDIKKTSIEKINLLEKLNVDFVIIKKFNEDGSLYLLSLRLIPTISFILINLVMGVLPISLKKFYYISQLGMLPATIVYVNAGSEISKVNNINDIMSFSLLLSFTLIAVFPFLTKWLISYFNTRKKIKY